MNERRGTAILVVMVVVVMMAFAAYGFVYLMQAEYSSVAFTREHAQGRPRWTRPVNALRGEAEALAERQR